MEASPPRKNKIRKRNFISGSLTRLVPRRAMKKRVQVGIYQSMTHITATNTRSQTLKLANRMPRASTVPKSVMKQAARVILPSGVSPSPPSIITA